MVPTAVWDQEEGVPLVDVASRQTEAPVSVAQERLWFLEQIAPDSPVNNCCAGVRIAGPLDQTTLDRSYRELFQRHACLRSVFSTARGRLSQNIFPLVNAPPLAWDELEGVEHLDSKIRHMAEEAARHPFDLTQGPLLRGNCLRLADQSYALLLSAPSIIADRDSLRILVEDLAALYMAFASGGSALAHGSPFEYSDFLRWQRDWLQSRQPETHLAYWQERLDGAAFGLELPADRPRPAIKTYQGASHYFSISARLRDTLEDFGRYCWRPSSRCFTTIPGRKILSSACPWHSVHSGSLSG